MRQVIKGFIVYDAGAWNENNFSFTAYRPSADISPEIVIVREHSFEVDVPDDFDPRPGVIERLLEKEQKVRADFQATITEIHRQISELQAIEHSPAGGFFHGDSHASPRHAERR